MARYIESQISYAEGTIRYIEESIKRDRQKLAAVKKELDELNYIKENYKECIYSDMKIYDDSLKGGFELIYAPRLQEFVSSLNEYFTAKELQAICKNSGVSNHYRCADKLLKQMKLRDKAKFSKSDGVWIKL